MKIIGFTPTAFAQYNEWADSDKKTRDKIIELIKDISRNPFKGKGKPEPLKHQLKGYWSRRINKEHRLVYKVSDDIITILACKYHY